MTAAPNDAQLVQSHTGTAAGDPTSPAGIVQAVVALLTPTLAATVDAAVQRGLEQLQLEIKAQAQRIAHTEERISSLEDDNTANSAVLARFSHSNRDLLDKLGNLKNRSRRNNLRNIGLPESISNAQLPDICAKIIPEQLSLRTPCVTERAHRIGQHTEHSAKPRPVIVRYLNCADKNAILQKFQHSSTLSIEGTNLLWYSLTTQQS